MLSPDGRWRVEFRPRYQGRCDVLEKLPGGSWVLRLAQVTGQTAGEWLARQGVEEMRVG